MKYKTFFRVVLKLMGVYFIGIGACGFVSMMFSLIASLSYRQVGGQQWYYFLNLVSPVVQVGLGVYLFLGGKWIADKAIPGNRPYCHECGYDLSGAIGNVCTECGTPFRPVEIARVHE